MTRPTPETLAHRANPATVAAAANAATTVAAPAPTSGAGALVRSLEALGVEVAFGIPGGAILPAYDPLYDSRGAAHPGPARAGRRARRHRVRAGHRQGRRLHRDQRPGRHQPGHPDRRRVHGLGADRRDHRPGGPARDRHGRLPGGGHPGHHAADHQAQLPGADRRRDPADPGRGVPPGRHRPARPGPGRHPQGRAPGADHVLLAADPRPARLPAHPAPARQADPRGGPADRRRPGARFSTSAAACSRPAPPTACASWPS